MFTCIGILAICIAVQVVMPATAQSPDTSVATSFRTMYNCDAVVMDNGDVYVTSENVGSISWTYNSNVFEAGPISNTDSSMGDVKWTFR